MDFFTNSNEEGTFSPIVDGQKLARLLKDISRRTTGDVRRTNQISLINVGIAEVFSQRIPQVLLPPSTPNGAEEDIWQAFERVLSEFPDDVLADLPTDLSSNHDHYLYGTRKK
jgi:hypothetical protein